MADTYNSWSRTSRSYESKNRFSPFLRSSFPCTVPLSCKPKGVEIKGSACDMENSCGRTSGVPGALDEVDTSGAGLAIDGIRGTGACEPSKTSGVG